MQAKKPLRAKKALKASREPKKRPKPTITKLRKQADIWFSRYVRVRDSELEDGARVGTCITCPRRIVVIDANGKWQKTANLGHFVGRSQFMTRFDEENCNLQCPHCNAWRDKESMLSAYKKAIDDKYGSGTAAKLVKLGREPHSFTRAELEQIISDSKTQVDFYMNQ